MGVHTCWIRVVNGLIATVQVYIRMPACYIDGVALQPSFGAGIVLACADMVEPCEGNILVPICAVLQKRLLNPLGGHAEDVAPAVAWEASIIPPNAPPPSPPFCKTRLDHALPSARKTVPISPPVTRYPTAKVKNQHSM